MTALTKVTVSMQRSGADPRLYLLTVRLDIQSVIPGGSFPQAHATVDDFGDLVIVRSWL